MKLIAAFAALLTAAACSTPYQSSGYRGGYSEESMGDGRYAISVRVNSYTGRDRATVYAHRRAGELCPGGYDVEDRDSGTNNQNKSSTVIVVRCK